MGNLVLKGTEDENRLRCECGGERWLINLEGLMNADGIHVVNSAECVSCHKIYSIHVEHDNRDATRAADAMRDAAAITALSTMIDEKDWPDELQGQFPIACSRNPVGNLLHSQARLAYSRIKALVYKDQHNDG